MIAFKTNVFQKFIVQIEGVKPPVSKHKLLLADDSITIQKVVNLTFADEGIEVIAVGDGDAALQKIKESTPDLVMADVNMPGLSGYQICETIKQNPEMKKIPVILLVGSFEPFDESEARRVGADDFMTKPFQSIRQLVTKVSALLEQNSQPENKTAESNDPEAFIDTLPGDEKPSNIDSEFHEADDEMIQTDHYTNFAAETTKLDPDYLSETETSEPAYDKIHTVSDFETETNEDFSSDRTDFADYQQPKIIETAKAESPTVDNKAFEISSENEYSPVYDFDEKAVDGETALKNAETEELPAQMINNFEGQTESETSPTDEIPTPNAASVLAFDDLDLLELPPIEPAAAQEKSAEKPSSEKIAETFQSEIATESGNFTASQLSPEAIEAIAQRVVEKLSEKFFDKEA